MQVVLVTLYIYSCYGIDITIYITCDNLLPDLEIEMKLCLGTTRQFSRMNRQ